MSTPRSRRAFLGTLAAASVSIPRRLFAGPATPADPGRTDPRLTARPGRPFRPLEPGLHRFGEHLPRGGILYLPPSVTPSEPAPLLVVLHGGGGDADRWTRLTDVCDERGMIMLAPDARGRTWDRVTGDFGPDVGFIDAALRYVFERCAIDPSRLALAGFSDGASYTLSLGPCNGDLFTHLIAWSPGLSNPADPIVGQPRVFVSHGSSDSVLPVGLSRGGIVPMFEMDGYDVTYVEFDGEHTLTPEILDRSLDWFLSAPQD